MYFDCSVLGYPLCLHNFIEAKPVLIGYIMQEYEELGFMAFEILMASQSENECQRRSSITS